jgi:acyl-CoA synthetase (AMP-forming)/AMP-acid ligase II
VAPLPLGLLRARLALHLAPFKLPRALLNADALPHSAVGKLDRRACAKLFEAAGHSLPDHISGL